MPSEMQSMQPGLKAAVLTPRAMAAIAVGRRPYHRPLPTSQELGWCNQVRYAIYRAQSLGCTGAYTALDHLEAFMNARYGLGRQTGWSRFLFRIKTGCPDLTCVLLDEWMRANPRLAQLIVGLPTDIPPVPPERLAALAR